MVSFVRVIVLTWADSLAFYAMWVMVTYLTNVWKLNYTHAAGIINIWGGIASILPIGFAFLVDTFMGNYAMLLVSSIAYSVGLGLLTLSTPPVLSNSTGTCRAYRPECIGDTQKALFYAALALIAVGISGHTVSLVPFFTKQITSVDQEDGRDKEWKVPWQIAGVFGVILVPVIGGFALPYIKPWTLRFGIPAICTLAATLLFLIGSRSYNYDGNGPLPQGSPLTTTFRVFAASVCNLCQPHPSGPKDLYETENDDTENKKLPLTRGLRCLDKAAILKETKPREEQEKNRWRLCRVTEVEETKIGIRMVPIWLTFIVCGIVSSIGNTYFLEQANKMNRKVGSLTVPLPILLMFYEISKSQFVKLYFSFAKWLSGLGLKKFAPSTGIAIAMTFSVLSCITAAKVETRRLDVIRRHGLVDKPDERIQMTMFWLLPQFVLLGALDGIADQSIECFFKDQAPPSMSEYLMYFTRGVLGLGIIGSVLSVHVVGKVSERGGKPNWFQETLNKSHLDNYYWTLAALGAVNLVFYILAACCYPYRESASSEEDAPEVDGSIEPYEENTQCCFC